MAAACFHCGVSVLAPGRYRAELLGAAREFCCAGCEAVARTIAAAGLDAYYETRSSVAATPAALPPVEDLDAAAAATEAALIVDRVRCAACLWLVEQTLQHAVGVTHAHVNYATQRAHVEWDPAKTSLSALVHAVREVGYDAYPYEPRRQAEVLRRESRKALWRLFVAGF